MKARKFSQTKPVENKKEQPGDEAILFDPTAIALVTFDDIDPGLVRSIRD